MKVVNLIFYDKHYNFGDQLSKVIVENLIDNTKFKLVYNSNIECDYNLVAIGSYIHMAPNNCIIYGSGIRSFPLKENYNCSNLRILSVRGNLTKQVLENSFNFLVPKIFGDPALLISKFYKPKTIKNLINKIGIIPHFTNYKFYNKKIVDNQYYIINTSNNWQDIIDEIYSCKVIISSSLHGLIVADTYNKPNIWLNEMKLEEGEFKFLDYFSSQSRPAINIKNISEFKYELLYTDGNKIDLDVLMNVFIFS